MAHSLLLVLTMQYQANSRPGAVPAAELAAYTIQVSKQLGIKPQIAAAIVLTESGGRAYAYNAVTHDHGLLQINERLAAQLRINKKCLYNWQCNMSMGLWYYSSLKRPCLYNLGKNRRLQGKYIQLCAKYETKLAQYL